MKSNSIDSNVFGLDLIGIRKKEENLDSSSPSQKKKCCF